MDHLIPNSLINEFEGYISRIGISPTNTSINEKLNAEHWVRKATRFLRNIDFYYHMNVSI